MWSLSKTFVTKDDHTKALTSKVDKSNCKEQATRLGDIDKAQQGLALKLEGLPTKTEFTQLSGEITSLTTELGEIKGRLGGVKHLTELMTEYLMKERKD